MHQVIDINCVVAKEQTTGCIEGVISVVVIGAASMRTSLRPVLQTLLQLEQPKLGPAVSICQNGLTRLAFRLLPTVYTDSAPKGNLSTLTAQSTFAGIRRYSFPVR